MKKLVLLLILLILLLSFNINVHNAAADETNPYTIYGSIKDKNGIAVEGTIITIENSNTKEKNSVSNDTIIGSPILVNTDSNGIYTFELINLKSGYSNGDEIIVTAEKDGIICSKSIIIEEGSWGAKVDITLGIEENQPKELWYDSLSNIWMLLFIVFLVALILILTLSKRRKPKEVSSSLVKVKKKLPPPPPRYKYRKDILSPYEKKESPLSKDEIPKEEIPPPDDEIPEDKLPPPDDEIPEDELPPPGDWMPEEELPPPDDEILEDEFPTPENDRKTQFGSLSRIGILYILLVEIIVIILMSSVKNTIEIL